MTEIHALNNLRATLNQPHPTEITATKTTTPGVGSDRWVVDGPAGAIVFDTIGPQLAVLTPDGDADSLLSRFANEAQDVAWRGDDNAMFDLLTHHYHRHLAG